MSKRISIVKPHPKAVAALRHRATPGPHLALGFQPNKALNLSFRGGRTLPDLQFKNVYLGSWSQSDMSDIDRALSGALMDPNLNHVVQEYFVGSAVTTHFLGSTQRGDASLVPKVTFDRDSVQKTLASLDITGIDLTRSVICLYLPPGVVLDTKTEAGIGNQKPGDENDKDSSLDGLGGYHGSVHLDGNTIYFAVAVYSQDSGGKINGIPFWPDPWKNVVATMYHELNEARTDPDVEEAIRTNKDELLGWYSDKGGEIGDIPINEAGEHLGRVLVEVPLVSGGSAPIQLMWCNEIGGPCGPF
jgi:hypothetical protein